ncbi:MAG: hypothetical protein IJT21_07280 [Synergistaceae bacterium]|nr:hypothetical protein [Synergistaceae bacterium]
MSNRKKFFALVVSVLIFLFEGNCKVFAMTLTVTNSSHAIADYGDIKNVMWVNGNENFSFTLTASDLVGSVVDWRLPVSFDQAGANGQEMQHISTLNFSHSGNTATITGTLHPDSYSLGLSIIAIDLDSNGNAVGDSLIAPAQYNGYIYNRERINNYPTPTPTPDTDSSTTELNVGVITPVVLSDDVLERIANNINIGVSELHFLTSRDFSTAIPPEPTNAMRKEVSDNGYEFAAKLNTINVSEDGWYVFQVTVPDDLVGKSVNDLRLFYAEDSDFVNIASMKGVKTAFGFMPIINGITGAFEVSDFFGVELDTLPKQFLATMFLSAGKSLTVYVLRILLMLLGGCNLGLIGGGVVLVGGLIVFKFFRRH